ncbi:MAG: DUF2256 and DUF3253 domain-containing protein [Myxococcota bacterium]
MKSRDREPLPDKTCARCGRRFEWRRKWADVWDEVRYCSTACRKARSRPEDEALERTILGLLAIRAAGATICPSEAARAVFPDDWRDEMEAARQAARRLVERGDLEITQKGRVVDPSTARGPIRLRLTAR